MRKIKPKCILEFIKELQAIYTKEGNLPVALCAKIAYNPLVDVIITSADKKEKTILIY